jgi:hypothetical protein
VNGALPPSLVPTILDSGYSFDAFDDGTLAEAQNRNYKVIVLPGVRWIPDATKQWLAGYVRGGGKIIAVDRLPEGDWPSLRPVRANDLQGALREAVQPDLTLTPAVGEIGFVHRDLGDTQVYFLANTSNRSHQVTARFRSATAYAELWDPMNGTTERIEARSGEVALAFEAYASRIVVFRAAAGSARVRSTRAEIANEALPSGWSATVAGTRTSDVMLPHSWAQSPATRYVSGTATYRRSWDAPPQFRADGARVYLDFGPATSVDREALADGTMRGNSFAAVVAAPIRDAATVFVNDRRVGTLWAPPYRIEMTPHLRSGSNDIRLEVYNTAINMLAEGGRVPDVRGVSETFGQRFRLQDMDAFTPLPSGVLSVPRVVAER